MKITFALITEGVSENQIIKHILSKYFKEREVFFRDIQPKVINGQQNSIGGWNEVLKFCESVEDLEQIFIYSDFLVIQIDTDQCQTYPFSISHTNQDNTTKSVEQLSNEVAKSLQKRIGDKNWEQFKSKIIFAICIHSIECWMLPIFYNDKRKSAILNCLDRLNEEIVKKNIRRINISDKNGFLSVRSYQEILKNWRQKYDIVESAQYNPAFLEFINSLAAIDS